MKKRQVSVIWLGGAVILATVLGGCRAPSPTAARGGAPFSPISFSPVPKQSEPKIIETDSEDAEADAEIERTSSAALNGEEGQPSSRWSSLWDRFGKTPRIPLPRTDLHADEDSSSDGSPEQHVSNDF